jgi:hypothetical protein
VKVILCPDCREVRVSRNLSLSGKIGARNGFVEEVL